MRAFVAVFSLALLAVLTACGAADTPTPIVIPIEPTVPPWQLTVQTDPFPQVVGPATLIVTVTTGEQASPVTGLTVSARGNMTHAGMAPVVAEGVEGDPGVYRVPWEWTMAGDWFVDFTLRSTEGAEVTQTVNVQVAS